MSVLSRALIPGLVVLAAEVSALSPSLVCKVLEVDKTTALCKILNTNELIYFNTILGTSFLNKPDSEFVYSKRYTILQTLLSNDFTEENYGKAIEYFYLVLGSWPPNELRTITHVLKLCKSIKDLELLRLNFPKGYEQFFKQKAETFEALEPKIEPKAVDPEPATILSETQLMMLNKVFGPNAKNIAELF